MGALCLEIELREVGRRGLLNTSGSGWAALVDCYKYVDERMVSLKGRELLDQASKLFTSLDAM
jgi:hypothetical protein